MYRENAKPKENTMGIWSLMSTWRARTAVHIVVLSALCWTAPFMPQATVKGEWGLSDSMGFHIGVIGIWLVVRVGIRCFRWAEGLELD